MRIATFLPVLDTLRHYSLRDLRGDFMAALTLTPMAIPQVMAYALIAGVHPQYGIYAAMLPVVVAALWGSSRYLVAGPTNAISMVLFSSVATLTVGGVALGSLPPEARMPYIFGIALLCGLLQLGMGLARLGELVNFISHSVMVGFATGAALLIGAGQLGTVLGFTGPKPTGFFPQILWAAQGLGNINLWSLGLASLTIVLCLLLRRISPRFPATLVALILVGLTAYLLDAPAHGVKLVGPIPSIIPPLSLPPGFELGIINDLFMPALAIALLGAVESLAMGKQLAAVRGDHFDGSRELVGQGLGNIAAGLTSGIPGCGSFTRSAVMIASGGRTRLGSALSGLLALPMLLALSPLVSWLPMPALGGVLLMVCAGMINLESFRFCFMATRVDRAVLLLTLGSTLLLDLERAVFVGVLASLILYIYKTSHPRVRRLEVDDPLLEDAPPDLPPGIAVYLIEGTLFFGAIHELERQLEAEEQQPARLVVLHLTRVFWLDASGAHALASFLERCHARSTPVILVVGSQNVRDVLARSRVLDGLSDGFVAGTTQEGLRMAVTLLRRIQGQDAHEARQPQDDTGAHPHSGTDTHHGA
ncbi:MAG: SulP family inorganic anion transporter [Desulfovibrio sp.]|nr:SulP family inorganic anion transporter [Desulfovibrio sp.]